MYDPSYKAREVENADSNSLTRLGEIFNAVIHANMTPGKEVQVLLEKENLEAWVNLSPARQSDLLGRYRQQGIGVGRRILIEKPATVGIFTFFYDPNLPKKGELDNAS